MKNFKIKLKNLFAVTFLSLAMVVCTISLVNAASGNTASTGYIGPNDTLYGSYATFNNLRGDGIDVTLAGVGSEKRVYGRMGEDGTYSSWAGATTAQISVTDYGPWGSIGNGDFSWHFYWR